MRSVLPTKLLSQPTTTDRVHFGGLETVFRVRSEDTHGSVSVVEHILGARLMGAAPHVHTREDETSFVLAGSLGVQIGGREYVIGPGDCVLKPRGIPHAFWNAGEDGVHFIEVIAPGGFERYFDELVPLIPRDRPADIEGILALAARYGLEFDLDGAEPIMRRYGLRWG